MQFEREELFLSWFGFKDDCADQLFQFAEENVVD